MRSVIVVLCSSLLCLATTSNAATSAELKPLLQAEILFEKQSGHIFDALQKAKKNTNKIDRLLDDLLLNDLLLDYGLSQQVEIKLNTEVGSNQQQKNHKLYQLAKFYNENQQPVKALQTLQKVQGEINPQDKRPLQQLTALIYIHVGKFRAAINILEKLAKDKNASVYVLHNLALAQLQSGNEEKGLSILKSLGQITGNDTEQSALKDLANLKLGNRYLDKGQPAHAKTYFNRVRMDSPFIEQTLLGTGWAAFAQGDVERAVVPWTLLHGSKMLSGSVIEAKMALPYAYAKLGAHGKAANLYGQTIETLETELSRLNTAVKHVQNGKLEQHLITAFEAQPKKVYTQLLTHDDKQVSYLHHLLTDSQFRLLANNLHDLVLSKNRLQQQQQNIDAFNELIALKQKYYATTQPESEKTIFKIYEEIKKIENKAALLKNSEQTKQALKPLKKRYKSYLQLRKNQASDYQQLDQQKKQLRKLSKQLNKLNNNLKPILTRAGKLLSLLAINKLKQQYTKLENYRENALFAFAESYDFATRDKK